MNGPDRADIVQLQPHQKGWEDAVMAGRHPMRAREWGLENQSRDLVRGCRVSGDGAPQGTAVDVNAISIDFRTGHKRIVREISGRIQAGFSCSAAACSIARIVDDQERGIWRPEIADDGPDGAD